MYVPSNIGRPFSCNSILQTRNESPNLSHYACHKRAPKTHTHMNTPPPLPTHNPLIFSTPELKPSPPNHPLTLHPQPLHDPLIPTPPLGPLVHFPKRRKVPPAVRRRPLARGAEERRCRAVGYGERAGHETPGGWGGGVSCVFFFVQSPA